ncbi:MAG: hypothetical protein WC799_08490 [Desulfobacteraceae bacterium]|jgi:hypothetical protein
MSNNNKPQRYTVSFTGTRFHDPKLEDIPVDDSEYIESDDIEVNEPAPNNTFMHQTKPTHIEPESRSIPMVLNEKGNYFEAKKETNVLPSNTLNTALGNDNMDISELNISGLRKKYPNLQEYIPVLLEIAKNITDKSNDKQTEALIRLLSSLAIDKKTSEKSDDEDENKKIVWNKICNIETEIFTKRDLTTSLQKWLNAAQIDHALKLLCKEGLISELKDNVTKRENGKPGRSKSPKYRVNNLGNEIIHNSKRSMYK